MRQLDRKATLVAKYLSLRIDENQMSIQYRVMDNTTSKSTGDVFVNFQPSEKLLNMLVDEATQAVNKLAKIK